MKKSNGMKLSPRWTLPDRAAFSTDQKTWQQTEPGEGDEHHSIWSVKIDSTTAWFAWGPPFVPTDAVALVDRLAKATPHATAFQLCRTRAGRTVPALIVTENGEDNGKRPVIWVQARQHAWESGGSWVGRGFAEWLTGDSPRAAALRQKAVVYYVPIMDIDNTATGNGGKEQVPYDHNRAWFAETQFNAVRVAMQRLREIDHQKRLVLFVDLHNPGSGATRPYFFVAPPELVSPQRFAQQERFIKACREEITDPWPLDEKLPVTGPKYDPLWKRMSANWIKQNTQQYVVGLTLETAWNTPHSHAAGYQSIGRRLGLSMELYLQTDPRDSAPAVQ